MSKVNIIIIALIVLIVGGILLFSGEKGGATGNPVASTELDSFAVCLAESDAKLFGAWWCPHCEEQIDMFGASKDFLPYIECSAPGSKAQNLVCKRENIEVYPTWKFADGSSIEGLLSFKDLSEITNCPLPGDITVEESAEVIPEENSEEILPDTTETETATSTQEDDSTATSTEEAPQQ